MRRWGIVSILVVLLLVLLPVTALGHGDDHDDRHDREKDDDRHDREKDDEDREHDREKDDEDREHHKKLLICHVPAGEIILIKKKDWDEHKDHGDFKIESKKDKKKCSPSSTSSTTTTTGETTTTVSSTTSSTVPTTTTTTQPEGFPVEVFVGGACVVDQNGTGLALMDFGPIVAVVFTINGVVYDAPPTFGQQAQFGVNVWSVVPKPGFVIVGPSSGEFFIEECGVPGTTTTTVPGETTTTVVVTTLQPEGSSTVPSMPTLVPEDPVTTQVSGSEGSEELPFTGLDGWVAPVALALLGIGALALLVSRGRED